MFVSAKATVAATRCDHTKIFLFGGGKKEIKVLDEWYYIRTH